MEKIKTWISNFIPVTRASAEKAALKAKEQGILEEKRWHTLEENREMIPGDIQEDYSYLYETDKYLPKREEELKEGKKGKSKRFLQKVLESFVGGFISLNNSLFGEGQSQDELQNMQLVVMNKYFTDAHVRSIISNWTHYTIGGGIKVHIDNEKVFDLITSFRKNNKMILREKMLIKMFFIEGELFISYYTRTKDGKVTIRRIRPIEISEIETHPTDLEMKFAYHWEYNYTPSGTQQVYKVDKWVKDFLYDSYKADKGPKSKKNRTVKTPVIQFIKEGIDTEVRGRIPIQPGLKYTKYYEDWLMDRIRLNHERAKVVWIKSIKGRHTETTERERRAPRGGIMLVETDNVKYRIENPKLASEDAKEDGLQILYTLGAATNLPIHILNQRSGEQVYASIRKADTPFSQFIRGQQEFFAEHFEEMYRFVIQQAVKAGELDEKVSIPTYSMESILNVMLIINEKVVEGVEHKEIIEIAHKALGPNIKTKEINTIDIPISLEFPEIIREDLKAQAEVFKIHKEMGIASRSTLAARAGYNWQKELSNMLNEHKIMSLLEPKSKDPEEDPKDPKDPKKPKSKEPKKPKSKDEE